MTALNIAQVKHDFENGTLICRSTIGKVIALAAEGQGTAAAAPVALDLTKLRAVLERLSSEPGYGFYRPANPHDFHPDADCCSPEEIAAHKAACEAYDKGEYTPAARVELHGMHILVASWGIGSYTARDAEAVELIAAIDAQLAGAAA